MSCKEKWLTVPKEAGKANKEAKVIYRKEPIIKIPKEDGMIIVEAASVAMSAKLI